MVAPVVLQSEAASRVRVLSGNPRAIGGFQRMDSSSSKGKDVASKIGVDPLHDSSRYVEGYDVSVNSGLEGCSVYSKTTPTTLALIFNAQAGSVHPIEATRSTLDGLQLGHDNSAGRSVDEEYWFMGS